MRITNQMTANTIMLNVNRNVGALDRTFQQMASGRQIQFASQNPILASRTLKFRTTISENEQFQRNLNQGNAFLEMSENAIAAVNQMMHTIRELTVQGASDTLTHADRQAIALNISNLVEEIGLQMNQTHAGRNIFTGLRTDEPAVFSRPNDSSFRITQHFNPLDIQPFRALGENGIVDAHRLILPYRHIDAGSIWIRPELQVDGNPVQVTHMSATEPGAFEPAPNQIIYLEDTGELIFGSGVMDAISELEPASFSITYNKTGFVRGDLNPKVYFDSVAWDQDSWREHLSTLPDKADVLMNFATTIGVAIPQDLEDRINAILSPAPPVDPPVDPPADPPEWVRYNQLERDLAPLLLEMEEFIRGYMEDNNIDDNFPSLAAFAPPEKRAFTMDNQSMEFEIGVGIRIPVNSLAKNIYTPEMHAVFREFTGFIEGITISSEAELRTRFSGEPYNLTGADLDNRIEAQISQETTHNRAVTQARFDDLLGAIDGFMADITTQRTDVGARISRLALIDDRLQDDNLSFRGLLSQNEDADIADVITRMNMLQAVYQASLHVGMNMMQTTLLDFLR